MPEDESNVDDDDRVNRLRSRRQKTREAGEQSEPDEPSNTSEASKPSKTGETSEQSETGDASETAGSSVKDELVGTYMYLPESLKKDIDRNYTKIKADYEFEYDEEFEKNRHYFQLIVQHGFGTVRDAEVGEVYEMVQALEE